MAKKLACKSCGSCTHWEVDLLDDHDTPHLDGVQGGQLKCLNCDTSTAVDINPHENFVVLDAD